MRRRRIAMRRMPGAMLIGAGLLAGLGGIVHAEIVPVAAPSVLVLDPAPTAEGESATVAEIVPARPNIRLPSEPVSAPPASNPAADHTSHPAVVVDGPEALPADDAAEITGVLQDPFKRALAAYRGDAHPRSYREAARWFSVAAAGGDRRAAIAHAYLQGLGLGVTRDPVAARRALRQASDAGIARADYLLSLLAAADRRPGSDRRQSQLRELAARRDDPVAQNAMGVHYQMQGDRTTATMWYQRAADNGSVAATLNLGSLAQADETRRQLDAAAGASRDGDAESLFQSARRQHRGDGVPVDYGKALLLYRQAAAKGSGPAQQMLGLIQSRTLPGGGFDPGWMRQLASAAVGQPGADNLVPSVTSAAQPRLDDPLAGLSDLVP